MNGGQPMETAPRDGTPIVGLYDGDGLDDGCLMRWSEERQCMLAGYAGGYGYFGPGWEDCENHLIVDTPIAWLPASEHHA
jgi:hypothetical protein